MDFRELTPAMADFLTKLEVLCTELLERHGRMPLQEIVVDRDLGISLGLMPGERCLVQLEAGKVFVRSDER